MRRLTASLLLAVLALGCGDDPARILAADCVFGPEHRLANPEGALVDDVAIAASDDALWALWSERAGTCARPIGLDGAPRGAAARIAARCDGGLASAERQGTIWIACGRRGDDAHDDEGGVQLLAMRNGAIEVRGAFGALGPDGEGIAIAIDPQGTPWLGWQRARGAVRESWLRRAADDAPPAERISTPPFRGSAPSLAFVGERLHAVWAETWLDARGNSEGRIQLRVGNRAPRAIAEIRFDWSMPVLRPDPGAGLLLAYRDRRSASERARAHLGRIDGERLELGRIERSLPANALGEALAIGCGGGVLAIAPRTRSRTERLVAIRRYQGSLEGGGPEHQIYEHGVAFEHVDARCIHDRVLVLVGARQTRVRSPSVRVTTLACREPGSSATPAGDQRTSRPPEKR